MADRDSVIAAVRAERDRQRSLWDRPHEWGHGDCSSADVPDPIKFAVLAEETGEVARALLEQNPDQLKTELVQVAAVAVAWLEAIA